MIHFFNYDDNNSFMQNIFPDNNPERDKEDDNSNNGIFDEIGNIITFSKIGIENGDHPLGEKKSLFNIIHPINFCGFKFSIEEYKFISIKILSTSKTKEKNGKKIDKFNIKKRIKSHFCKFIKLLLKIILKRAGSKQFYTYFPQIFVLDVHIERNQKLSNMTLKELLNQDYSTLYENEINEDCPDYKKIKHNKSVFEYLNKNKSIRDNNAFLSLQNMKYHELFEEYIKSIFFEILLEMIKEKESKDYAEKYKNTAEDFLEILNKKD